MIFIAGVVLVLLLALVFVVVVRTGELRLPSTRKGWLWLAGAAILTMVLLGRPDEDIQAGEDPGVYFNSALAFSRQQSLKFPDAALMELAPDQRPLFRYGHAKFLLTKDVSLWAKNAEMSEMGPHFLPAYSILLGIPATLGFPFGMFWIGPLLAVMSGCILAMLARWLTQLQPAAWLAYWLYILNPIVIWNARCLRAEGPASFLVLSGLYIWLAHVALEKPVPAARSFLGGLALTLAMSFHVTAVYVVLPGLILSLWFCRTNRFWAGWWAGLASGIGLFAVQLIWITDPYGIQSNLLNDSRRYLLLSALLLIIAGVIIARRIWGRWKQRAVVEKFSQSLWPGYILGGAFVVLTMVITMIRNDLGQIPGLPEWSTSYLSLTDFSGVRAIISSPWSAFALLGVVALCGLPGPPGRLGRMLFLLLGPATLAIGWVFNYMFETRRMMTFLAPLLVLATIASLLVISRVTAKIVDNSARRQTLSVSVMILIATVIILFAVHGRERLYTTWNNRGVFQFCRGIADNVTLEGDFLLAEYTQTAVPIEKLSGRPLLPLAWGYRSDDEYRAAERAMSELVRRKPGQRFLFLTPFGNIGLPGLGYEHMFSANLRSIQIGRARRAVPTHLVPRDLTMHVSRVTAPDKQTALPVYVRLMDGSRVGMSGLANPMPNRTISMNGLRVDARVERELHLSIPDPLISARCYFIFGNPLGRPPGQLSISRIDGIEAVSRRFTIHQNWDLVELDLAPILEERPRNISIHSSDLVYLINTFWVPTQSEQPVTLPPGEPMEEFSVSGLDAQWLLSESALALPYEPSRRFLFMLATHGRDEDLEVKATLARRSSTDASHAWILPRGWHWHMIPLAERPVPEASLEWYDMTIQPPWNPGLSNFPTNLGLRVYMLFSPPAPAVED